MHSKQFCIHTASFSAYKQLGNTLKSPITACFLSIYLATDQSSQLLIIMNGYTGSSSWKSWLQPSVLDTFYDILKLSLVLTHPVGWALLLLGKKFDISAQFDYIEWVFWSLLFLQNLRFYGFSVFLKNSFLFQMRINDQI